MRLGLIEPPPDDTRQTLKQLGHDVQPGAINASSLSSDESEWFELRPRWPLTMERHPSCMPSDKLRSAKKARQHMSLTEMTLLELEVLSKADRGTQRAAAL